MLKFRVHFGLRGFALIGWTPRIGADCAGRCRMTKPSPVPSGCFVNCPKLNQSVKVVQRSPEAEAPAATSDRATPPSNWDPTRPRGELGEPVGLTIYAPTARHGRANSCQICARCRLQLREKEGRDALCPPKTHHRPRSPPP